MRNIKLNSKKIFVIVLSGFILVTSIGCSNAKNQYDNYNGNINNINSTSSIQVQTPTTNSTNNVQIQIPTSTTTYPSSNSTTLNDTITEDDKEVISYFEKLKQNIKDILDSETVENAEDKLKGTFITAVDFVFYDGEINGIKFDDLTEGAKQNILETISFIDDTIMIKFPNYKEEISSTVSGAYNKASELIKNGANNVKEFSKEKLGEQNYNAIIEVKDELVSYTKQAIGVVGGFTGSLWDKGKEKVKNWYEKFKGN